MLTEVNIVTGRKVWLQSLINIFPKSFRLRFNPRRYEIETFVQQSVRKLQANSKVLDAGAGPLPYKHFFNHCKYEATDFIDPHKILDFTCSLDKIPKLANTYNAILCTEVLEHVENPQQVMNEFYRILKKSGKLFITVPQGWMLHQEPYNFFYYTKYGLASLLKKSGFKKFTIRPMGGYFKLLADTLRFNSIAEQWKTNKLIYIPLSILDTILFKIIASFILFHLDWIDKRQKWSMGYTLEATK